MEQQVITDISLSARIIGAAFYYPPTEKSDIVELLSSGKWLTEWPYGSEEEKQRIASLLAQTTYQDETLAQAYQRLFIGPYALPAPPWGSVYLDHENVLFGDSTLINSMSNHLAIFHDHRAKGTPTNFHILCGKRNGLLYKLLI